MQEKVREKIKNLVAKYETEKAAGKIAKYSEEETKRGFIEPLFEALGWDFSSKQEITLEEQISGDRVDYGFYLNGRIKFYLEAKKIAVDLHREDYAKQAIRYSWNKGVNWAVLTDFESVIVFNALSPEKTLAGKRYFEIPYTEYLERFDQLWLLSKEAILAGELDKEAEKHGKKLQKVSVTEKLAEDLNRCRKLLTEAFTTWNKGVPADLIDEGVQKLLDRLIFIRVAEDRKIEPPTLTPLLHQWKSGGQSGKTSPYQAMVQKFRELDKIYDSNLFSPHPFEQWEEFSGATEAVIEILYGDKNYFEYDFSAIPADVLGAVYENYLGYKLEQSKKDLDLSKDKRKRKEQGIYYTPRFIVDYIVQNALGPVLDKCKSINDLKKIKVLDPACGSGSFLVAAMNFLIKKYEEFGATADGFLKIQVLQNNIYGVDLDQQAVELARLNLLLNTFDAQTKLPSLSSNIKNGNSLISGTDEELEKYFGKNYRDKKPFNWQEEFPEVFKQGGFDVIIGNPPYVGARELGLSDKTFFESSYVTAKEQYDLYILFIEKSLNLLKASGYLSFIVPNKFLITRYGMELRKLILETSTLVAFQDYSDANVFPDASVYPVVIVLDKVKSPQLKITDDYNLLDTFGFAKQNSVISKIESIREVVKIKVWRPIAASSNVIDGNHVVISNREVSRYCFETKNKGSLNKVRDIDFSKNKIIMKKLCYNLEASLDEFGYYPINTTYCIKLENADNKYILGLLNSKLLTYYVRQKYSETALRGGFIELRVFQIEKLPLIDALKNEQNKIASLVEKMLSLNKEFKASTENSDQWQKLKDEIAKTDKKIDEEVYKLYGLTEEEIGVVEGKV